jgi:predicted nucleic acid-binding Zn ribbon protein
MAGAHSSFNPQVETALTKSPLCDRHHRIPDRLRVTVGTMQTIDSQQQSWRDRAREIRALGDQMRDQLAKEEMLRLANKYERLADWTEEQARHSSAIP